MCLVCCYFKVFSLPTQCSSTQCAIAVFFPFKTSKEKKPKHIRNLCLTFTAAKVALLRHRFNICSSTFVPVCLRQNLGCQMRVDLKQADTESVASWQHYMLYGSCEGTPATYEKKCCCCR